MSGLREALVKTLHEHEYPEGGPPDECRCGKKLDTLTTCVIQRHQADAVLRVLAKHGDTQQVRYEIRDVIEQTTGEPIFPPTMDAVMAVVAPHLARAEAAEAEVKRLAAARLVIAVFGVPETAPQPFALHRSDGRAPIGLGVQWPGGAVTIKWTPPERLATVTSASLADALAQYDPDGEMSVLWLSEDLGTLAEVEERVERLEARLRDGLTDREREVPDRKSTREAFGEPTDMEKIREEIEAGVVAPWGTRRSRIAIVSGVMAVVARIVAARDAAVERADEAERSRDKLLASGERHLNDLMTIADKNLARAERAEAECARRGDLLNAVVELVEHREARYAETNGTTINAVPVADLRRALGPAPSDSEELDGHNEGPGRLL